MISNNIPTIQQYRITPFRIINPPETVQWDKYLEDRYPDSNVDNQGGNGFDIKFRHVQYKLQTEETSNRDTDQNVRVGERNVGTVAQEAEGRDSHTEEAEVDCRNWRQHHANQLHQSRYSRRYECFSTNH